MNSVGIYAIRNTINGAVYVGRASNLEKRKRRHFAMLAKGTHHSIKLQCAFDKHGGAAFVAETLVICSRENLGLYEQLAIDGLMACEHGYNIARVSGAPMAGRRSTIEANLKRSASLKGREKSPQTRQLLSAALLGVRHSSERIENNRKARSKAESRAATSERMSGNKNAAGSVRSEEQKARYSASWTPARKAALAERMRLKNPRSG